MACNAGSDMSRVDHRLEHARRTYDFLDWAAVFLPFLVWLRRYNVRQNLLVRPLLLAMLSSPVHIR